jgi:hypothetical protein
MAALAWQDTKRVTITPPYHKDEMCGYKVKQEETKPVVLCDYNINTLGVDMKDQMLQPYLMEQKKGTKWYMKLFKRLLNAAIHNAMVMYHSLSNNKNIDSLKFFTSTRPHGKTRFWCSLSCTQLSIK